MTSTDAALFDEPYEQGRAASNMEIVILMPVFDDWDNLGEVWSRLDDTLAHCQHTTAHIVCVDDGSTTDLPSSLTEKAFHHVESVTVLVLKRNVGHQRAIAIGLMHIYENLRCDGVVCMDSDGQDIPEHVLDLLQEFERLGRKAAIFAGRKKRLEGRIFQAGYFLYQVVHRILTGFGVQIGNFSVLPFRYLSTLSVSPELWSHYAATVVKTRLPMLRYPLDRGSRLKGRSKMNYVSLVIHGLSALSVYGELVATRLLIGGCITLVALIGALVGSGLLQMQGGMKLNTLSVGFAVTTVLLLTGMLMLCFLFAFGLLAKRDQLGFLPIRDATFFVSDIVSINDTAAAHGPLRELDIHSVL